MGKKLLFFSLIAIWLLSACQFGPTVQRGSESSSPELEQVSVGMGYIPNVQFAPFYLAASKGYFAERSLEVTYDYGMAPDLLSLVANGTLDFAITDADQVLLARERGIPVVAVMPYYRLLPLSIVSLAESDISNAQDLVGKTIGLPGLYGASYVALLAYLQQTLGSVDGVTLEPVGYTQVESLLSRQVDAVLVFANNEPLKLTDQGVAFNEISLTDTLPFAGAVLVTSDTLVNERPEVVRETVAALELGFYYAAQHQEEAFESCIGEIPEMTEVSYPLQKKILQASVRWWPKLNADYGFYFDPMLWQQTADALQASGLIYLVKYQNQAWTNEFLMNDPD